MNSPTSVGTAKTLSQPTLSWEKIGEFPVNEGPAALYHGGKTFLTYSASYCWTSSYQLGLLTYKSGDPTNSASWTKSGPVFSSANGNYGTGHNGYVCNEIQTLVGLQLTDFIASSTVRTIRKFGMSTTPQQTRLVLVMATDIQRLRELTGTPMAVLTLVRQSSLVRLLMVHQVNRIHNGGSTANWSLVLGMELRW